MDQAAISQLSDADLVKTMERTINDIDYGCWPLHEYMATACRLTLEWTRRQREIDFVPAESAWEAWEIREKAAHLVVDVVGDCLQLIATGQSQKAAHTAALAANFFFSYGPTTALYDMQEAERIKAEELSNRNKINSRHDRPGGRDPMKQRIVEAMRSCKAQGMTLDDFLRAWKGDIKNDLELLVVDESVRHDKKEYVVRDQRVYSQETEALPDKPRNHGNFREHWKEA